MWMSTRWQDAWKTLEAILHCGETESARGDPRGQVDSAEYAESLMMAA